MLSAAMAIELCGLCPVEPACGRRQMLEYFGAARPGADPARSTVNGEPYRCWLLAILERVKQGG